MQFSFFALSFVPLLAQLVTLLMPAVWFRMQSDSWPSPLDSNFPHGGWTGGPSAPESVQLLFVIGLLIQVVLFLPYLWLLVVHAVGRRTGTLRLALVWALPTAWCFLAMTGDIGSLGQLHEWALD